MLGLFDGKSSTHFKAISRNPSISFTSISPISITASVSSSLSKTSLPFPSPTLIFTHPTRFVSPKSSLSVGRRPVMISSNTTPNEYTSPLADVARLHIPVYDVRNAVVVQEAEPLSCPASYLLPLIPAQCRIPLPPSPVKHVLEASVPHVLVHQQPFFADLAVAQQWY
ncbi:hypothetical protein IEQ34_018390 [Dendrobium chrysotoxum]|uniref:Uncharacterized protein n=1 Tax=Dendrobium chrysotoxum TaxID=161865 RepID=A0AAV7GC66_DENCH|nr:hypothetical protein IEQ34_018390 [Dendrobium chrysotoxum]